MRYFLCVGRYLNFSKAAKHAYTTQPTISKNIACLEQELGVKLFNRNTKNVELTSAGKYLFDQLTKITKDLDDTIETLKTFSHEVTGTIRIGLNGQLDIDHIVPGIFKDFAETYPNIKLIINSLGFNDLRFKLIDSEMDIILTYSFEEKHNKDINRLILSRSNPRIYYLKEDFPNEGPTLEELRKKVLISLNSDESLGARKYVDDLCKKNNISLENSIKVDSLETVKFYIESGMGIAVLGSSYRIANNPKLSFVEINDSSAMIGTDALWLIKNKNSALPLFLKALTDHIKD